MPRLFTRADAREYLNEKGLKLSASALTNLAAGGRGPKFAIIHGRAVYREDDLDAWLAQQFERATSAPKGRRLAAEVAA